MAGQFFTPNLSRLPPPQLRLWQELGQVPSDFVLYGGTAVALRLGHRSSVDFDFFSSQSFEPQHLKELGLLRGEGLVRFDQDQTNTLTAVLDRGGPVKVSFLGGLQNLHRVCDPDMAAGPKIQVASLLDLAAMKLAAIQARAAAKDYLDLEAMIQAGIDLPQGLAAARAVYGSRFDVTLSLRALRYYGDGDLNEVPDEIQRRLTGLADSVDVSKLPSLEKQVGLSPGDQQR